jgi:hypothetical protein
MIASMLFKKGPLSTGQQVLMYLLLVPVGLFLILFVVFRSHLSPPTSYLIEKLNHYRAYKSHYNVIFAGDSRTFTNIRPQLVDPLLQNDTKSYNLGVFAHWLPTQKPFLADLAEEIPKGTTVVWSIGHQNFLHAGSYPIIQTAYPLHLAEFWQYPKWGMDFDEMLTNGMYYNAKFFYDMKRLLPKARSFLYETLNIRVAAPSNSQNSKSIIQTSGKVNDSANSNLKQSIEVLNGLSSVQLEKNQRNFKIDTSYANEVPNFYKEDYPNAKSISAITDEGFITSLVVLDDDGSYNRVELNFNYFRKKQKVYEASYQPPPSYKFEEKVAPYLFKMFTEILDTFHAKGVHLIVNFIGEAPMIYPSEAWKNHYREYMNTVIRSEIEKRGFSVMEADVSSFKSEDYFDYNHMNSRGARKYAVSLAAALNSQLKP